MTAKELQAIRERAGAATPGPWVWDVNSHCKEMSLHSVRWPMNIVMNFVRWGMSGAAPRFNRDGIMQRADTMLKSYPGKEHHEGFDDYVDHPDAAFIAAAREDVPALCDEVERLQDAQRWVDAEYDTPDIGQLVLLYLPDKETDKIRAGEYLGEGDYRIGQKLYRGMEISAWMPLPAPPKGE